MVYFLLRRSPSLELFLFFQSSVLTATAPALVFGSLPHFRTNKIDHISETNDDRS